MQILALDAALASCSVALTIFGPAGDPTAARVLAHSVAAGGRGQPATLAPMLAQAVGALPDGLALDAVAVTVGPGSFTGLRSALALAHGVASGRCPVIGVTVAEALEEALAGTAQLRGRPVWTAIDSRRGRVFLSIGGIVRPFGLDSLPSPDRPVALAGDAAEAVAAVLAARGCDILLTGAAVPDARFVASVGARRLCGALPWLEASPLYVDPPEAKLPAGGLRPYPLPPNTP